MLGRRRIDTNSINGSVAPPRSSLVDVAWAVEERVVWGSADALRRLARLVKRPFEEIALVGEERLVWPLQERTDHWGTPLRAAATSGLVLLAAGAVAAGVVFAKGSGDNGASATPSEAAAVAPTPAPAVTQPPTDAPVLKGAAPDFTPEAGGGTTTPAAISEATGAATATAATAPSTGAKEAAASPGPAAIEVARKFAAAFVLYETGRGNDAKVRAAFAETATPELTRSLLQRPPRLPANVKVPQAKVLNVVPGPRSGDTYTFSVSLLRVGVTSELRIEMERGPQNGESPATGMERRNQNDEWRVTDARG
jgi:hypothetical protein